MGLIRNDKPTSERPKPPSPTMTNTKPPKKSKGMEISIIDLDMYKDTIELIIEIIEDIRIDEAIRLYYYDKLAEIIVVKNYHIEI